MTKYIDQYILSLDQGTTSSRAILFDNKGKILAVDQKEFKQIYPKVGWVEHDASEIWESQILVAQNCIQKAGISEKQIAAIGITNQRETTVVWDKETGKPVCNAIVWQDRRTAKICDQMKKDGWMQKIQMKTGLILDAYFSASKIQWILENISDARENACAGKLAFGTIDSWLLWNLTGAKAHITDVTNASRTMLYNIHSLEWDEELLTKFEIPSAMLPQVMASSELYGYTEPTLFGGVSIPITGIAGDQQAALFGQMCSKVGMVKNTYGTGCFMLMNVGNQPVLSKNNLVTTIAWQINDKVDYALEGSIFIGGAVVQWLRDGLGIISSSSEVEDLAKTVKDPDGVYIVPAFTGLGAPYWEQHARGTIVGLTRGTTSGHLARAALECIAFQTLDILKLMEADSGVSIKELRVDGGAALNNLLMQFQADVLGEEVIRPEVTEITALGAAYLAGLAVGYWKNLDDIQLQWQVNRKFQPTKGINIKSAIKEWNRAIETARSWGKKN